MTIRRISNLLFVIALTLFSAVTHAQAPRDVVVINGAENPVPVTINSFPRTPFAIQLLGTWVAPFPTGANQCAVSFNVQTEQLLVIEGVAVAGASFGFVTRTEVTAVTNTVPVTHSYGAIDNQGGAASHQLRLYADAGSPVDFLITNFNSFPPEPCAVSVSGYLISPESPSLGP